MPSGVQRIQTERIVDRLVAEGLAALPDLERARLALDQLSVLSGDRAVFATCVLTLEMALLRDDQARAALPGFVGVLLEAHRDPRLANLLVAGSPELEARWQRIQPIVADFVGAQQAAPLPPPPAAPARPNPRLATPTELIQEIEEILEAEEIAPPPAPQPSGPPPPPQEALGPAAGPPPPPRDDDPAQALPDPEMRDFWGYAERALGRVPDPEESLVGTQSFAAGRASDRSALVRFAHDLLARFPAERHARALAALTLLYVASHEKQRGLLGVNRERLKLLRTALSLVGGGDPAAAGRVAVLFENDGLATRRSFAGVVDLVGGFLSFCSRERLDPKSADAPARYTSSPRG